MNVTTKNKGFTIIEVVLVLAIAALIFLMIFVAFPALQRGQKNTARKDDLSTIAAAVNTYRSNHGGSLPGDTTALGSYIDKLSQIDKDQVKVVDNSTTFSATASDSQLDQAWVVKSAKCNDSGTFDTTASTKSAAVITVTQTSGSGYDYICQDV